VFFWTITHKVFTAEMINLLCRRSVLSVTIEKILGRAGENPISRIEDNIENAMDAFVLAALDTYHYKDVSELEELYFTLLKDMKL
jgi:hypothetical protein